MEAFLVAMLLWFHGHCTRTPAGVDAICIKEFKSTSETQTSEKFEAPSRVRVKPFRINQDKEGNMSTGANRSLAQAGSLQDNRPMHCIYKFIAKPGERVALNFTSFWLRGDEPECRHEYVDIYINLKPEEQLETAIGRELPNGRFCTSVMPHKILSLHNMIVLAIYSDLEPPPDQRPLFTGTFEFTKPKTRDQIGAPEDGTLCSHMIYGTSKREGEFQSITYPGVYVKNLRCAYRFIGEPKQRIRLEFLDLDLYSGGSHCPIDSIKVFDGLEETDTLINTICGSHRSLIIYSTREHMLVTFTTLQREAEVQNRGFSAYFEFSDKFFDPTFIQGQNAKHIRGSECDQRIVSRKGTRGVIVSPESKNHPNAVCRYIFEGLQNSLDYEKVLLKFTEFDLKIPHFVGATPTQQTLTTSTTTFAPIASQTTIANNLLLLNQPVPSGDSNASNSTNTSVEQCPDNYVRLYTGEQKPDQKQDPNDYDYVFCGSEVPTTNIESDAASLLMEYNSGSIGGFFRAEYSFIVDYRIPGIQASSGCTYVYRSDYMKTGIFNSPRHPSWYISEMNCTYTFLTKSDEALLLQFTTFKMANSFNEKVIGHGDACEGEDMVEIFELSLDSSEQRIIDQTEVGTYCGTTTPGPILSFKPVRINFITNKEQVHYGFWATYNFYPISGLKTNEFVSNCGDQIHAGPRLRTGTISSPPTYRSETYEKRNHICSWNITARPSHKIALDFHRFELEGSPLVRGCATASVRLVTNRSQVPIELCGTLPASNSSAHQFVSENEWLSITFISTKQASGSNGFSATWSEIKRSS